MEIWLANQSAWEKYGPCGYERQNMDNCFAAMELSGEKLSVAQAAWYQIRKAGISHFFIVFSKDEEAKLSEYGKILFSKPIHEKSNEGTRLLGYILEDLQDCDPGSYQVVSINEDSPQGSLLEEEKRRIAVEVRNH